MAESEQTATENENFFGVVSATVLDDERILTSGEPFETEPEAGGDGTSGRTGQDGSKPSPTVKLKEQPMVKRPEPSAIDKELMMTYMVKDVGHTVASTSDDSQATADGAAAVTDCCEPSTVTANRTAVTIEVHGNVKAAAASALNDERILTSGGPFETEPAACGDVNSGQIEQGGPKPSPTVKFKEQPTVERPGPSEIDKDSTMTYVVKDAEHAAAGTSDDAQATATVPNQQTGTRMITRRMRQFQMMEYKKAIRNDRSRSPIRHKKRTMNNKSGNAATPDEKILLDMNSDND